MDPAATVRAGVQVVCVATAEEAERLRDAGFCPVECAFGDRSVVDELGLDHHGQLSHLEPVSIRAWRDLHGRRRDDPRFVTAGAVDADAGFAMAALAGLVPAPSEGDARTAAIAELIAVIDVDPVGRDLLDHPGFGYLRLWSLLHRDGDLASGAAAVHAFGTICTRSEAAMAPLLAAARETERSRRELAAEQARRCRVEVAGLDPRVLVLDGATVWGFDVWYGRDGSIAPDEPEAWSVAVVLSRDTHGVVTVGLPNLPVAERLLGAGGLRTLYPVLEPAGWGGREAIGGSPRGLALDRAQLTAAARTIARHLGTEEDLR